MATLAIKDAIPRIPGTGYVSCSSFVVENPGGPVTTCFVVTSLCRRRNAIFRRKILAGADGRTNCPILPPGVPGSPLWAANAHGSHVATWTSGTHRRYWTDCGGNPGSHFHA